MVATGARAWRLPIEGSELTLTSDEILDLEKLPKKLAIIGAGYIALEFASIYNNYGADVHVFFRQVSPLPLQISKQAVRPYFLGSSAQVEHVCLHSDLLLACLRWVSCR